MLTWFSGLRAQISVARSPSELLAERFRRVEDALTDLPEAQPLLARGRTASWQDDNAALLPVLEELETIDMLERNW